MSNVEFAEISKKVLDRYHIDNYELDFIGQSANIIYRVTETHSKKRFSLRIPESSSQGLEKDWGTKESIQSELIWLEALASETDFIVPNPIRNKENELITQFCFNNKVLNCTLLSWIDGEQKQFVPSENDARKVGEMIGKLHYQSSRWNVPDGFSRPSFDMNKLDHSLIKIQSAMNQGVITNDGENLISAGQKAKSIMMKLEKTNTSWGIIHADLIPANLIFHDDSVSPIDFGACGFGFYLADLGWTFSYIHPSFREGLLDSYSKVFSLPVNCETLLETFFVAGQLDTIGFWLGKPDSTEWLGHHLSKLANREFHSYLNDKSFFYTGTPYWE